MDPTAGADLMRAAKALERAFLADMLKASGLGESVGAFGGGAGEDAFASMLADEYARHVSERVDLGLAGRIHAALLQRSEP